MWRCTCGAQLCSRHASRLCWYVMAYKPSLNKPGLPTMPLQRLLLSHLFSLWFPRMFFSIHLNIPQSRSASGAILFEASHLLQRCSTELLPLFSVPVKTGWRRHQSASSNTLIRRRGRAHRSDSPSQLSFISPAGFSISCRMSDILLLCSLNVSQPVWSVSEDAVTLTHSHCVWSTLTVLPDDNELLQSEQRVSETFVSTTTWEKWLLKYSSTLWCCCTVETVRWSISADYLLIMIEDIMMSSSAGLKAHYSEVMSSSDLTRLVYGSPEGQDKDRNVNCVSDLRAPVLFSICENFLFLIGPLFSRWLGPEFHLTH